MYVGVPIYKKYVKKIYCIILRNCTKIENDDFFLYFVRFLQYVQYMFCDFMNF